MALLDEVLPPTVSGVRRNNVNSRHNVKINKVFRIIISYKIPLP